MLLRETGFIDTKALAESANISGSREEKIMLATGDQAYVGFPKDRPLHAGERYSVFVADTKNPVRAPDTGEILGYLVRVYGDIVVDQMADRNVGPRHADGPGRAGRARLRGQPQGAPVQADRAAARPA